MKEPDPERILFTPAPIACRTKEPDQLAVNRPTCGHHNNFEDSMRAIAILIASTCVGTKTSAQLADLHDPRERHLANVKQLTDGGENAEAYWSFDGKKIIFQHRGGDIKADQIFTMNADGSDKRMVSTGKGRCTCSYFLPGDKQIIFSSTHAYSPDVPVDPDRSHGYVWPIYPYMSIYRANADG